MMATLTTHWRNELTVGLQTGKEAAARLLAWEAVRLSDLRPMRDETWLAGLRAGILPPDPDVAVMTVLPGESLGPLHLQGYTIELHAEANSFRRHFATASLEHVARRAAKRLIEDQVLKPDQDFHFFVTAHPPNENVTHVSGESEAPVLVGSGLNHPAGPASAVETHTEPLDFEYASLAQYASHAQRWVGPVSASSPVPEGTTDPTVPVFFPNQLWQEAHELARRGGELESAALFTGRLARDTDSPEIFLLIDDCIVASYTSATSHSVLFSGDTWHILHERLEQRRCRLGHSNEIFVGSVHGHNFGPALDEHGRKTCDACDQQPICSRTTAVTSPDDVLWHQSVFCGQPWAVLLVWGWNARNEEEWRLYGLQNGTLSPRSLYIL